MGYSWKEQVTWAYKIASVHKGGVILYTLLEIMNVALFLASVYLSKRAIDIATKAQEGDLFWTVVCMASSMIVAVLAGLLGSALCERLKIRQTRRIQNILVQSLMMQSWTVAKRWHTGDLQMRLNNDCADVVQMLSQTLPMLFVTALKLIGSLALMWSMDPMLVGLVLAITPLFFFSKIYYRRMRRISVAAKNEESKLGVVMQENLKQRLLVRSLNVFPARWLKFENTQNSLVAVRDSLIKFSIFTRGAVTLAFIGGYLLAFIWGIYRLHTGSITFGTMTAFLQLVGRIQEPIVSMIAFIPAFIRCRTAFDRLMELNEGKAETVLMPRVVKESQELSLENVSFRYDDLWVVKNFSVCFRRGVPTAVVGATGKGKTTLIRLLLAMIKPNDGNIFFTENGQRIGVGADTRINFSYVPQGNTLFAGTIRENLKLTNPNVSDDKLEEVLMMACAGFVLELPDGLDTVIGESGRGLSEGQAQRIAVARALLQSGDVWLFDEATSALDRTTADNLIANLIEAGHDKILIFVTHDANVTRVCSQVIQLK